MRIKHFAISLVLATTLFATEQKVDIVAKNVEHQDGVVTATGTAVAIGKGYYIKADKIVYDRNNEIVEAFGNVYALKDSSSYILSDYAKIFVNEKSGSFDKFFMQNQADDVWVSSKSANAKQRYYDVNNSITSSCSVDKPEWHIKYSKGVFDTEEKQMTLSDAVFYAGQTPLFYSPYLSFSTDKTRRSGLLKPEFGIKGDDGFVFAQPFYFVSNPDSNWDSETTPQIRTTRGVGLFETLRFIDSPYSKGSLTFGYFGDKDSYKQKYDLRYSSHYGASFLYDRKKIFANTSKGEQDGLYADLNYLNDIDFKNLQDFNKNGIAQNTDAIATSKLNYFYQKNQDYFGSYLRYYFDTSKSSNDSTIQQLPKLQYHRYLNTLFLDNLIYSGDAKITRYDRKTGATANQYEAFVPLSLDFSFFDDYLGVSFSENLYMNKATFANSVNQLYSDYSFSSTIHKLKAYTSLVKPYENFIHTLGADMIYTKNGAENIKNTPTSAMLTSSDRDILSGVTTSNAANQDVAYSPSFDQAHLNSAEYASFRLAQFFYDKKGSQIVSHKLRQTVYTDTKNVDNKYSDLENEVEVKVNDNVSIGTDIFYSHKDSKISTATTSVTYKDDDDLKLSLSQTYKNVTPNMTQSPSDSGKANYLSLSFDKKFSYRYYTFGNYDYDYQVKQERSWALGVGMKKRCFNYQVSVKRETTPVLTSAGSNSVNNFVLYLSVNFVPIGGINQVYSVK